MADVNNTADASAAELLKRLIACRSVTPHQDGALDLAEEMLRAAGFLTQRLPAGNVDNLWAADNNSPSLLFAGHVDVVPPGDLTAWRGDPFVAEERGGYIYGRGAADMKSGVAAMLVAARNLRRDGIGGVAVLLTSDEEGDAVHGTQHVAQWRRQNSSAKIPFVIIGEPTCETEFGDAIKIGRRGSLTARIIVRGVQAHAAYPQKGDNPIHRLQIALSAILRRAAELRAAADDKTIPEQEAAFPPLGVQIVKIEGGIAENVIPSAASATINFRCARRSDSDLLRRAVETALQNAAADRWECEWRGGAAPFFSPPGALVAALRESIFAVCGRHAALSAAGGTSDGRFLREIADEIAEFGVVGETMHAANERVASDSAPMLAQVYEMTARRLLADARKT